MAKLQNILLEFGTQRSEKDFMDTSRGRGYNLIYLLKGSGQFVVYVDGRTFNRCVTSLSSFPVNTCNPNTDS